MKKLFTLLTIASLAFTIQAQDITHKTGTNGKMYIKNSADETEFTFESNLVNEAELKIGKNIESIGPNVWNFEVQSKILGPYISFTALEDTPAGSQLNFRKGRVDTAIKSISDDDELGAINFAGYMGSGFHTSAAITSISLENGTTSPSGNLKFWTKIADAGSMLERMTIKADGTINIDDLKGTYSNGEAFVVVNNAGDISAQDAAPAKAPMGFQIQQLKEENIALKAEMAELRSMIEMLMKKK